MLNYRCPFTNRGTLLLARNQEELDDKVRTHNAVSHGPLAFVLCGEKLVDVGMRPVELTTANAIEILSGGVRKARPYSRKGRAA